MSSTLAGNAIEYQMAHRREITDCKGSSEAFVSAQTLVVIGLINRHPILDEITPANLSGAQELFHNLKTRRIVSRRDQYYSADWRYSGDPQGGTFEAAEARTG
jgi:hypothetical protein